MPLITCKVELKLKCEWRILFSVGSTKIIINKEDNAIIIMFTIKDTKLNVPVVTLSARDN